MTEQNPARIADGDPEQPTAVDPVHAVGIGPGNTDFLTQRALQLVESADVVVGFETVTDRIAGRTDAEILQCDYDNQTAVLDTFGQRVADGDRGVAVLWGDPNISGYQFLGRVETAVDGPVKVVPGISSVQIAASRSRTPLEHSTFASLHRRGEITDDLDRLAAVAGTRHLILLVRPYDWMPPEISTALLDRGVDAGLEALVLQELTLPDESVERTTLGSLAEIEEKSSERYSDRTILTVRAR